MEWVSQTADAAHWYLWFSIQKRCRSLWGPQGGRGPGPNPQTSLCHHPPTSYLPNPPGTNPKTHRTWGPLIIFPRWQFYKLMFYFILNVFFLLGKHYKHYTKSKMGMSHCSILDMATLLMQSTNVFNYCYLLPIFWGDCRGFKSKVLQIHLQNLPADTLSDNYNMAGPISII